MAAKKAIPKKNLCFSREARRVGVTMVAMVMVMVMQTLVTVRAAANKQTNMHNGKKKRKKIRDGDSALEGACRGANGGSGCVIDGMAMFPKVGLLMHEISIKQVDSGVIDLRR